MNKLDVSVVIPSLNSPIIDKTINSLKAQSYPFEKMEVIIVGDDNFGLIKEDKNIKFIRKPSNAPKAMNIGVKHATGKYLFFTDADVVLSKDCIAYLVKCHVEENVDIVGGRLLYNGDNFWTMCDSLSWFHHTQEVTERGVAIHLPSANLSVRREVLLEVKGFDEELATGYDMDFSQKLRRKGYQIFYEPRAVAYHHPPKRNSLRSILKHSYVYGYYSIENRLKYMDLLKTPKIMRSASLLLLLSPFISFSSSVRILLKHIKAFKHPLTFPVVFLTKLAWCYGAFQKLRARGFA